MIERLMEEAKNGDTETVLDLLAKAEDPEARIELLN